MTKHTPSACLAAINITASNLENTDSLEEEFRIIKKVYHLKILKEHPVRTVVVGLSFRPLLKTSCLVMSSSFGDVLVHSSLFYEPLSLEPLFQH